MPFVQTNPIQMDDNKANALVIREKVGGINYVEVDTINGSEVIRLLPTGIGDIRCFVNSAEGITRYLGISGYKTSGSLAEARLGVGVHTDQVLSIYNAQGYYMDASLDVAKDTNTTCYFGRAVVGYSGQHDEAAYAHFNHNTWATMALSQGGSGHTILNAGSGKSITIRINQSVIATVISTGIGIGVTPAQKFEIGSNDNSDRISIYHTNADAYIKTSDGSVIVQTDEGTNTDTILEIRPKGNQSGILRIYNDTAGLRYWEMASESTVMQMKIGTCQQTDFFGAANTDVRFFKDAADGETRYVQITGRRTGGVQADARFAVGIHADQVLSIYNCAGYYFDNPVGINVALPLATIHTLGTAIFDMTDNTGGVWKVVEGAREYIYISTLDGSEAIDFGGPSDAVEYNFRGDGHVSIQGGLKTTNKVLAGDGFIDDTAARAAEDSLLGHFHVFVTPSGTDNDYFAFGDKANGHTILVTNNGSVNALIDQDETGGMDLCPARTAVCRWDQGTGTWYYA